MTTNGSQATRRALSRVAIVGCGTAAREFCLPVLAKYADFRSSAVLVDSQQSQAEAVADEFGIQHYCSDYQRLPVEVDAAIVTTPHHLHAEQSIHFLRQGKSVFVEKPLGMSSDEVAQMLDAATSGGATLMVNNCRRLFPTYRKIYEMIHSGQCGKVLRIIINDGTTFDWNSVSAFYLRNAQVAKGVFLDRGAHTVDILCWWLADKLHVVDAQYDATGGAEALMKVQLASNDTTIQLAFSRLYKLENCYSIECEKANIHGRMFDPKSLQVERDGRTETITVGKPGLYHEYAWKLIENFVAVTQGREPPLFVAADVAPSIGVIEEVYRQSHPFELPWYEVDPNISFIRASQGTTSTP